MINSILSYKKIVTRIILNIEHCLIEFSLLVNSVLVLRYESSYELKKGSGVQMIYCGVQFNDNRCNLVAEK